MKKSQTRSAVSCPLRRARMGIQLARSLCARSHAFSRQLGRNVPRSIERPCRVEFIDAMLERHLLCRRERRLIIETGATQTQQIRVHSQRQLCRLVCGIPLDQRQTLNSTQAGGQIVFSASSPGLSAVQFRHRVRLPSVRDCALHPAPGRSG